MSDFKVATLRDELSQFWHDHKYLWVNLPNAGFATIDRSQAFVVAKDQLQDTADAMLCHRRRGFSTAPLAGYVELWGLLQAVILQQDAIIEIEYAVTGRRPSISGGSQWKAARKIRNLLAGHSSWNSRSDDKIIRRCTIGRQNMGYERIEYKVYENGTPKHAVLNLGNLLDLHDKEAASHLESSFSALRRHILALPAVAEPRHE